MNFIRKTRAIVLTFFAMMTAGAVPVPAEELVLAQDGKTDYQIVTPAATAKDVYNAELLRDFLKEKTGAQFPVVGSGRMEKNAKSIFLGISEPAKKYIGDYPLRDLKDHEVISRSYGDDIVIYGKGYDGDFLALMDFLEEYFNWRWYEKFTVPEIKKESSLVMKPFERRHQWSFRWREILHPYLSSYYVGATNAADKGARWRSRFTDKTPYYFLPSKYEDYHDFHPAIEPEFRMVGNFVHTNFMIIPTFKHPLKPKTAENLFYSWNMEKDYFETKPEFFSMDKTGKRIPSNEHCFSNRELRREYTKNLEKLLEANGTNRGFISIAYDDNTAHPCACEDCAELEKKYGTPGGPIMEYIMEAAEYFKEKYPDVMLTTLAYRTTQTQKPPKLPEGKRFPDNVIIYYAPVENYFNRDWDDPRNQPAFEYLKEWTKIAKNIIVWYYSPQYGPNVPHLTTRFIADAMKKARSVGANGFMYEWVWHMTRTTKHSSTGFTPLQLYLHQRLLKDVSLDTDIVVNEFINHVYGPAAKQVRQYYDELDRAYAANPMGIRLGSSDFNRELAYLTLERLYNWSKLLDEAGVAVKGTDYQKKLEMLRAPLDIAVIMRWGELKKQYPDYFKDHMVFLDRAGKPEGQSFEEFLLKIQYAGNEKPLPEQFAKIDPAKIQRLVPKNHRPNFKSEMDAVREDKDAAFGYAATIKFPDLPFQAGFYQQDVKGHGARIRITEKEMTPGKYQLFHLGEIQPTRDCVIWFSARSWGTNLQLGHLYDLVDTTAKWDAWISLKFPENYKGANEDYVLCDQVILVRK